MWKVEKEAGATGSNAMMFDRSDLIQRRGPMQKVKLEPGRKCIYRTHTTREGAERCCGFFTEEVKSRLPSLAEWLK